MLFVFLVLLWPENIFIFGLLSYVDLRSVSVFGDLNVSVLRNDVSHNAGERFPSFFSFFLVMFKEPLIWLEDGHVCDVHPAEGEALRQEVVRQAVKDASAWVNETEVVILNGAGFYRVHS